MTITQEDLDSFNEFVTERLRDGKADLTLEDCLRVWREECEVLEELRIADAQFAAGQVWTMEESERDIREHLQKLQDGRKQDV